MSSFEELELTELAILECENQIEYLERQLATAKVQKANLTIDLKRIKNREGKTELGIELEDQRIGLGLTINDLCTLSNISTPAYRAMIRGESNPRVKTIKKVKTTLKNFSSLRRFK